jgi:sigma-B regulation protein RsbU (phosphoserine phosphatase)
MMLPTNDDPGAMISEINRFVMKRFPTCRFVTLTLLAVDNRTLEMRFATAGQPFYRMIATGEFATCDSDNGPVGIFDDDKFATAQAEPLRPGELLLLTSDGFREAINPERAMYGEERLFSCVRTHQAEPSRRIIESLFADVEQFQAGSEDHDDMTAIVVRLTAKK